MNVIDNALRQRECHADPRTIGTASAAELAPVATMNSRPAELFRLAIVTAVFAVALLLSLMLNPARAATSSIVIKMGDVPPEFEPAQVTIKAGETVEWLNNGGVVHSVTAVPDDASNAMDVALPKGASTFDSGFMPPGSRFDHTFTVPGTYHYFCVPHETYGMVGTIVVKK